eukprot:9933496-Alexandrium_andersonii.AAC.1
MSASLVGSEMCIRDSSMHNPQGKRFEFGHASTLWHLASEGPTMSDSIITAQSCLNHNSTRAHQGVGNRETQTNRQPRVGTVPWEWEVGASLPG